MTMRDALTAGDTPMLVMIGDDNARYPFRSDRLRIGRDPENDLVVQDRRVSRFHAEIIRTDGAYVLHDNDSKNGTYVNGEKVVGRHHLQDGDEIQVALCCQLIFVGPGATAPLFVDISDEYRPESPALSLDAKALRVWVGDIELMPPLSPAQFRLLHLLWSDPEKVFDRGEIAQAVWPEESQEGISEQAIDAVVRRLRERLSLAGLENIVVTVRGHGFRLDIPH